MRAGTRRACGRDTHGSGSTSRSTASCRRRPEDTVATLSAAVRGGFLLDPEIAYLNHGSYGACSIPVFEEYQRLQRELEREPTDFFTRRLAPSLGEQPGTLAQARAALARFVGSSVDD